MNIMLIAVSILFIICILSGLIAGFLKKASGILSFILAGIIVSAVLPPVTSWLRTSTPLYGMLQKQVGAVAVSLAEKAVAGALSGQDGNIHIPDVTSGQGEDQDGSGEDAAVAGTPDADMGSAASQALNPDGSVNRDAVKEILARYGYDGSAIDHMSDDQIKSFIAQYAGGVTAGAVDLFPACAADIFHGNVLLRAAVSSAGLFRADRALAEEVSAPGTEEEEDYLGAFRAMTENMTASDRRKFIESLPLPKALQEQMETFNNSEGYAKLGAQDFASYVTGYFANLILNVIAYVVTLLIAWLIIRLIIGALGIFTRLPLISTADRLLGLAAGFLQALLIAWGAFLFISLISSTPAGQAMMEQIYDSPFLETLYNTNIFLRGASSAMKGIL